MKKTLSTIGFSLFILTQSLLAGDDCKSGECGFSKAAKNYDQKAQAAAKNGKHEAAAIYTRMADIKRAAAEGKVKNWDEYHKLSGQLGEAMGWNKGGKCEDKKCDKKKKGFSDYQSKKYEKKKKSYGSKSKQKTEHFPQAKKSKSPAISNEKATSLSLKYENQAKNHIDLADEALGKGDHKSSAIHNDLAQLMIDASIEVRKGTKPNFEQYFKTQKKLFSEE